MTTEHDNLKVLRRGADAWDRRDRDGWIAEFDPQAEYIAARGELDGEVFRGTAGLVRFWDGVFSIWSEAQRRDFECLAAGEWVLQLSDLFMRAADSGAGFTMQIAFVYRIPDGLCTYCRQDLDVARARAEFERATAGIPVIAEQLPGSLSA